MKVTLDNGKVYVITDPEFRMAIEMLLETVIKAQADKDAIVKKESPHD